MQPMLVVFIDSFPYDYLDHAPFLSSLAQRIRLIPGFGYSSTNQVELLSGLTPDDLGYYGEWTYDPDNSPFRRWRLPLRMASPVRHIYYLDRAAHRVLGKVTKLAVKNVPFSQIGYFSHPYISVFDKRFPRDSLLKLPNVKGAFSYNYGSLPWPEIDRAVYKRAKELIAELHEGQHLVVSMTKLDMIGHLFGPDSPQYREKIAELDCWLADLYESLLARFPSGILAVMSDHGMANVSRGVTPNIEKVFGSPRPDKYFYYLDGTLLRVWTAKKSLAGEIGDFLQELKIGSVATPSERASFGLTSSSFGDVIFMIDEPLMFVPCFWGGRISRGMHGYHPANPSQHGIFLMSSVGDNITDDRRTLRNVDVYPKLRALCESAL